MVLLYHGTDTKSGISIARAGEILCPAAIELEDLRAVYREQPNRSFEEEYPGREMKEVAIDWASGDYGDHELEHRVKSVSLAFDLGNAKGYASHTKSEFPNGGVVLGIDYSEEFLSSLGYSPSKLHIVYIPWSADVSDLREVHVSPIARMHQELLEKEFSKYKPRFLSFDLAH